MNYINLNNIYRPYSFPDYWSMREAKTKIRRVVIAKVFREIKETMYLGIGVMPIRTT